MLFGLHETHLARHITECTVPVVVVEDVLAIVGDKEVEIAVVVVVADADSLSPAMPDQPSLLGDVGKGSVSIVLIEVVGRLQALGKIFYSPAIDDEDVEPAIVVVVEESDSAPSRRQQKIFGSRDGDERESLLPSSRDPDLEWP